MVGRSDGSERSIRAARRRRDHGAGPGLGRDGWRRSPPPALPGGRGRGRRAALDQALWLAVRPEAAKALVVRVGRGRLVWLDPADALVCGVDRGDLLGPDVADALVVRVERRDLL